MRVKLIILSLIASLFVYGQSTFRIESGTNIVSVNDPIINLHNTDLYNGTGSNDISNGTIWGFTGNITQSILGTPVNKFYGLRLNNPIGFILSDNTTITNRLDMLAGDISCSSYSLEIGENSTNIGLINWTSGTVIGPLKRWFASSTNSTQSSGIFPIGNTSTNRNVIINYTQAPTIGGYLTVEYKSGIPSMIDNYSGLPLWASDGQVVQNYEDAGYFEITPDNYSSSLNSKAYTLSIRGNSLLNVNNNSIIRLIKSPGPSHTTWVPAGNHLSVSGTNSDFTVTSTGVTGFSWFNFGSQNENPLPVELLYFEGYPYSTFNNLRWSTASEHNSSYFEVENSLDGEDWKSVGMKSAAQNSTVQLNYAYLHNIEHFAINYYRLKQVDMNGEFKIYGPIAIDNTRKDKRVIKYVNLIGQEVNQDSEGVVLEMYEDGSVKRIK